MVLTQCQKCEFDLVKRTFVTGYAARLPGAERIADLAQVLFDGRDVVTEVPQDRWQHGFFLHPVPGTKGKTYTFAAGIVPSLWDFDPAVFRISPREAGQMDPQQRMLLHVVWEALEDAGLPPDGLAGQHVGVYVGCSAMGHASRLAQDAAITDAYLMTGNTLALVSNRISHVLDLRGPSMTVDTACSSSLMALRLAEEALLRGEIDTAIVAGVNAILDPNHYVGFSAARMLSPTGRCKPFSAAADGYARAEGAVAIVLERRHLADLSPRRARAVLVGVETNTDGHTVNVAMPSVQGQAALLRRVYDRTGVSPDDLAFVEAHGTGTLAGDPVEAAALGQVLGQARRAPLPIGSIKSNIGHLEPASGLAGMMKAILALERGVFPATLHVDALNPDIPFDDLNLAVARTAVPLLPPAGRPLCAGVSSFGFGGANAHAILEAVSAPAPATAATARQEPILMLSAASETALRQSMADWSAVAAATADRPALVELCAQAASYRARLPQRVAVLADTPDEMADVLRRGARGEGDARLVTGQGILRDAPVAFVFSGNGSQYAGMGLAALATDAAYARAFRRIDRRFRQLAGWSLIQTLHAGDLAQRLPDAEIAQPLLFADQIAQVEAFAARGLFPAAVLGHSGGEVAAAHAAGILSLDQALAVVVQRSRRARPLRGTGTMAAIQAPRDEVEQALNSFGGGLEIAADNAPRSVTIAGPVDAVTAFLHHAKRQLRWPAVRLGIDYPYHGRAFATVAHDLLQDLAGLTPRSGHVPFVSSVTGRLAEGAELGADYWRANMCRPVAFRAGMQTLRDMGLPAYLEIGAMPVLQGYMAANLGTELVLRGFEMTAPHPVNPVRQVVARAAVHGLRLAPGRLLPRPQGMRNDLPHYPWSGTALRIDTTPAIRSRLGLTDSAHPFLGREEGPEVHVWYAEMDAHVRPNLRDHRVAGRVVMPGTLLAEMALAAAHAATGADRLMLADLALVAPVMLGSQTMTELQTRLSDDRGRVAILSRPRGDGGAHRPHLHARIYPADVDGLPDPAPDPSPHSGDKTGDRLYVAARRLGLDYGPAFALLERVRRLPGGVVEGFLRDGPPAGGEGTRTLLDVTGADAALHAVLSALEDSETQRRGMAFVPVRIERLLLLHPWARIRSVRLHLRHVGQRSLLVDVALYDGQGRAVAQMKGVRLQAARLVRDVSLTQHAFRQALQPMPSSVPEAVAVPDADAIRALVSAVPEDESHFLIEAAAQAMAAQALRCRADLAADGLLRLPVDAPPLLSALIAMSLRGGALEPAGPGWRITEIGRSADPAPLLDLIDRDHPALGAEVAILSRLAELLPQLVCAPPPDLPVPQAMFGRAALDNLAEGSPYRQARLALLAQIVTARLAALPNGQTLRLAEVTDGTARLLPMVLPLIDDRRAILTEIVLPPALAEMAQPLPADRIQRITATPEALEKARPFDLVLSDTALAQAAAPQAALALLGASLSPAGQLALIEAAPSDMADLVHGLDAGWFRRGMTAEGPLSPLLAASELTVMAQRAGLLGAEVLPLPGACGAATLLLARGTVASTRAGAGRDPANPSLATAIAAGLAGGKDAIVPLPGSPARLLALFPQGGAGLDALAAAKARLLAVRDLCARAEQQGARLILVVPGGTGQAGGAADPGQTGLWVLLRSAANEYPTLAMARYDIAADVPPPEAAARIAGIEAAATDETEVVIRATGDAALRVHHGLVPHHGLTGNTLMRSLLHAPATANLDDLRWSLEPRLAPGPGEVEIAVTAAGLNYRDVMWSMGLLPEEALERGLAGPTIGIECAGHVLRCGAGVVGLAPGDAVMAFGPSCFASHLTLPSGRLTRLPPGIPPEAAATVPVAFFTAWYALVTLANLRAGEWVLIHGGAGGVGLAAIQIARHLGARVIATAGSDVKRAYLRRQGADHVLDSRSLRFADEVRSLTGGQGVDAVLNALAGAGMERSLACLAPFGRFLELGKQDFYANTTIGLRPLKDNIAYFGIDVDQVMAARPDLASRLFSEVVAAFAQGHLRPLPYRLFPATAAVPAFRLMQKSGHLGKVLLRPADPATVTLDDAPLGRLAIRADATQLIVGGLGGLGLELGEWLVDAGARRIALMGRRAEPGPTAAAAIARWRSKGAEVVLVPCDVADPDALATALAQLRPLAGVFHSAMVLEDMPLAQVTDAVLDRVLPAKIAGAAHLDRLTRGDGLDHFVLFTSLATLIGNHGQSAYVAANGHLEGIARARRAAGLAALAVGWGGIGDVGYLARDRDRAAMVRRMSGNVDFTGVQAMRALERILALGDRADPVVHVSPMGWSAAAATLRTLAEPSFALFQTLGRTAEVDSPDDDLRAALVGMTRPRAEAWLTAWLTTRIARILQVPEAALSASRPVSDLGIDSLMGVELGLSLQEALGEAMPVTAVSDSLSIEEIAARLVRHLHGDGAEPEGVTATDLRLVGQHLSAPLAAEDAAPSAPVAPVIEAAE